MAEKNLNDILLEYFDLIDSFLGSIKHHLGSSEDSHIELGHKMSSYPLVSDLIMDAIEDASDEIYNFWNANAEIAYNAIRNQNSLKCLYSGDLSPFILERFVKRTSLYIDTVILPDPLLNLSLVQKQINFDKSYYLNKLIRHVFNIWKLKDLILANTSEKILVILPVNINIIRQTVKDELINIADARLVGYLNCIFQTSLSTKEEFYHEFQRYKKPEEIFAAVKKHGMLPNSFKTVKGISDFFSDFADTEKYYKAKMSSIGSRFVLYASSQFIRVQEHKFFCDKFLSEPIYDYDLPWFFFNYEMGGLDMDASIANALQKERFDWIGAKEVPLSAFKIFREENRLDYMRGILRRGITDLKAKTDKDLIEVSEQLEKNLKEAFLQQSGELMQLKSEASKIAKKDIPITVSGCIAGFIPVAGDVISVVEAGRDVRNLINKRQTINKEIEKQEGSLINLLVKSYDGK